MSLLLICATAVNAVNAIALTLLPSTASHWLAILSAFVAGMCFRSLIKQYHEPTDGGPGPIPPGQSSPDARRRQ